MTQHLEQRTENSRDDYETPEWYLDLVREVFDDRGIVLDPATAAHNPTQAHYRFYPPNDGLALSWEGYRTCFCNPPYGRALLPWAKKIVEEARWNNYMIVLTPGRPDTRWFDLLATNCRAQADHKKRIKFKGCKDPAKFPSTSWYFGPQPERFAEVFKPYCRVRVGGLV